MSLTIGIVGLPNVGKSTLFNALTRNDVLAANYPFATIEPNTGVVGLPDPRLEALAGLYHSERTVAATMTFVDIAGIVRGASQGQGLGNKFLAHIREADAICQVLRGFTDSDVTHVEGRVSPQHDLETIHTELILADLQTVENALPRLEKQARNAKETAPQLAAAQQAHHLLDQGTTLAAAAATHQIDLAPLRELSLLTAKPFIYVFNIDADELANEALRLELTTLVAPAQAIFLDARLEADLAELDPAEAAELLVSVGQQESGLVQLAHTGFATLGLQTFLTAGPKEARAWTIRAGAKAPEAAGVIHTDFQKHFIKAEVISFDQLMQAGSMVNARAQGLARMEGKEYVMQDGDVVEFRVSV